MWPPQCIWMLGIICEPLLHVHKLVGWSKSGDFSLIWCSWYVLCITSTFVAKSILVSVGHKRSRSMWRSFLGRQCFLLNLMPFMDADFGKKDLLVFCCCTGPFSFSALRDILLEENHSTVQMYPFKATWYSISIIIAKIIILVLSSLPTCLSDI